MKSHCLFASNTASKEDEECGNSPNVPEQGQSGLISRYQRLRVLAGFLGVFKKTGSRFVPKFFLTSPEPCIEKKGVTKRMLP